MWEFKHPLSLSWDTYWPTIGALTEVSKPFLKVTCCSFLPFSKIEKDGSCCDYLLFYLASCRSDQQLPNLWHGPLLCHFITFLALYSVSNQVSEVQVSFINFRLLSSETPLHTCTLQTLHDVLAMAAQGFCNLGNITDLQYM